LSISVTRRDVDRGGSSDRGRHGQAPSRACAGELRPRRHERPPPGVRRGRAPPGQRGQAPNRSSAGELHPGASAGELRQWLARETSVRGGAGELWPGAGRATSARAAPASSQHGRDGRDAAMAVGKLVICQALPVVDCGLVFENLRG
jgi:hypothetical protein